MTDLKIDQDALATLVAKGILDGLTAETREQVIFDAIKAVVLTPPRRNSYDPPGKSPIQEAFEMATRTALQDIVRERVMAAGSDVRARIEATVDEFIVAFPDHWATHDVQTDALAAVVRHIREKAEGGR